MASLKDILARIATEEGILKKDTETLTDAVHGVIMRQNEARENIKTLQKEYREEALRRASAIFATGDSLDIFVSLAQEKGNIIPIDVDALYRRMADRVEMTFGGKHTRTFDITQSQAVVAVIHDVMREVGEKNYKFIHAGEPVVTATYPALVAHVKRLVRKAYGDSLNVQYVTKAIADYALEHKYTPSVIPVVLTGADAAEVKALGNIFLASVEVTVPEDVDEKFVLKTFKALKSEAKKSN